MHYDIFFAVSQDEIDGRKLSERKVFENFFDQVRLSDELGFNTAWVAETHLSSEVQKANPGAVIPEYRGELGLNTDILQLAHKIFAQTKTIHVGSAIRNILCNGGPMAHAEAIRMFLSLHALDPNESRLLNIGFASGRFPYSNTPYGVRPRNEVEKKAWPVLRGLVFAEATEIFLRFLRGDIFSSRDVKPKILRRALFRSDADWASVLAAHGQGDVDSIEVPSFWVFDKSGVIPFEAPLKNLRLTIGSHEASVQALANQFLPVGVFNLSITPGSVIEETHARMSSAYHRDGGEWNRSLMPRTALVFIDEKRERALARAEKALKAYWQAMEGTVTQDKVDQAVNNALVGTREEVREQVQSRFHPDDRVMFWFDFNNHDNENVKKSMRLLMESLQ